MTLLTPVLIVAALVAAPAPAAPAGGPILGQEAAPVGSEALPHAVSSLAGVWEGTLTIGGQSLRLVFRVAQDGQAEMDSPDQGAHNIAARAEQIGEDAIFRVVTPALQVRGPVAPDGLSIAAVLSQGGASLPIVLTRTAGAAVLTARPQTPQPPYAYRAEAAAIDNPQAPGVRLAGTLTLPEGSGPFPAAILISGSGPQDRDETIEGHKPFAIWADALTRRGVAVLRYDDRGVAGSSGDFAAATQQDFAADARAALDWLSARSDIDAQRIGFIGHSEGATVAQLAIQAGAPAAWLATLAGPTVPGGEIIVEQVRSLARAAGQAPEAVEAAAGLQRRLMEAVARNHADPEAARREVETLLLEGGQSAEAARRNAQAMSGAWYRGMVAHDPADAIRSVRVPMLAVFGERDVQVRPEQNAPALARLKPEAEVVVLPGLNHLLQPAETGLPNEYGRIETSLDPSALRTVVDWVTKRSAP